MTARRRSLWTWLWLGWFASFLYVELPAGLNSASLDTLSEHCWLWFPTWWWWLIPAGLLLSLAAHLSPRHCSVRPVVVFGALMVARIVYVERLSLTLLCVLAIGLVPAVVQVRRRQ
jgi:hypothetical protein